MPASRVSSDPIQSICSILQLCHDDIQDLHLEAAMAMLMELSNELGYPVVNKYEGKRTTDAELLNSN